MIAQRRHQRASSRGRSARQNSLTDKNSSDAGCQFPTNLLRDGNSGNTQNEHFSKDSEILSETCRMLDMYEENLFGDALDIKCAEEH
jgi:hypothetical protein